MLMPRKFPISFRYMGKRETHYAILGIAHVAGGYPLYYDAINEKGVGMAGLNFVGKCQPVFPYSRFSGSAAGML